MFKKLFSRFAGTDDTKDETSESELSDKPVDASTLPETSEEKSEDEGSENLTYIESSGPSENEEEASAGEPVDKEALKGRVEEMMRTIFDPEIPVNVYDIGLIYKIEPRDDGIVELIMTLITPNCPAAGILPGEVESKARSVDGVKDVEFELTFDPPWNPDMMSEGAKLELGMM